jgi:hypothetical protein
VDSLDRMTEMNHNDDKLEVEAFLELIPKEHIPSDKALDAVERIELAGRDLVSNALSTADRAGVREAHLRVAATLDALSRKTSRKAGSRIRSLAEHWRLTGETLKSPSSRPREVRLSRSFSETIASQRVINQSAPTRITSRSSTQSQISSNPSSSNKFS